MPCFLSIPFSKSSTFPRPALPGVLSRAGLSATLPARTGPRGFPVGACTPPTGLPVLPRLLPSCRNAGATTPAGTIRCVCRLLPEPPSAFPRSQGGSAPALPVSRPTQRFTPVPACMVTEPPRAPLLPKCFNLHRYLHEPPKLLPTGATVVGWDPHPPARSALPRRTEVPKSKSIWPLP